MKIKRKRRSRKLNNQFSHVYTNMISSSQSNGKEPWSPIFNRLAKDLLLDLQDFQAFPSNSYLHEQMHVLQEQAKRISELKRKKNNEDVNWDSIFSAVKDSDLIWESKVEQETNQLISKCFALVNEDGLNYSDTALILSSLGGTQLSDHKVIHVNCVSLIRLKPLSEKQEALLERPVKHIMLDLIRGEMNLHNGWSDLSVDRRTLWEKIYDWFLLKVV